MRKESQPTHGISARALPLPPPSHHPLNHPVPLQPKARTCGKSPTVSPETTVVTFRRGPIPPGPRAWRSGNTWVRSPRCSGPGARLLGVGIVTAPRGLRTSPFVLLRFGGGQGSNVMFGFCARVQPWGDPKNKQPDSLDTIRLRGVSP